MFTEVNRSGSPQFNYTEFIIEQDSDISTLPSTEKEIALGSKAFSASGNVFVFFGNLKKWVLFKGYMNNGGGGSGGGGSDDEGGTSEEDVEPIDSSTISSLFDNF